MSDQEPKAAQGQPPRLVLSRELEAIYANLVRITHSPSEIVLDFAQLLPGAPTAPIKARVLMSPLSAKLFYRALGENLSKYEANFGEIPMPGTNSLAARLFRPPPAAPDNEPDAE
jgi:hypothetical protein